MQVSVGHVVCVVLEPCCVIMAESVCISSSSSSSSSSSFCTKECVGIDRVLEWCSADAQLNIKEVDVGLAADVGTLQRIGKVMGHHSKIREWCYTSRNIPAAECREVGLVSGVFPDQATLVHEALKLAAVIATKSPVAVAGTKHNLIYARDHSVADGLNYVATWNAACLQVPC